MATLPLQFTASLAGTQLTLVISSAATYGADVTNFDIALSYSTALASYVSSTGGAGYLYTANPTTGKATLAGISDAGVPAGSVLATLVFTTKTSFADFPVTLTNTALNSDAPASGTADPVVPCFVKGTLIATKHGETAVEDLAEGDLVRTLDGALLPIRWIGHRRVACGLHPLPHDVMPVRIQSGAIAEGVPVRDLLLSPDHAVLLDGILIPARYLLNGATIVQEQWSVVTYFHIELERHAVVLAEGLAAETYLDSGNRAAFDGETTTIVVLPSAALAIWAEKACAPLVYEGDRLEQARAALLRRAEQLGHVTTKEPLLHLVVDGKRIAATRKGDTYGFNVPAGARSVRLCSRDFVPGELIAASADMRRLGVAVERLEVDGVLCTEAGTDGWYDSEAGLRWTNGNAAIPTPGRRIVVTLAPLGLYRAAAPMQSEGAVSIGARAA